MERPTRTETSETFSHVADSELNECGGTLRPEEVAKTTIEDDLQKTSPVAAEEMKLEEYNYYSDGSSQSDFGGKTIESWY